MGWFPHQAVISADNDRMCSCICSDNEKRCKAARALSGCKGVQSESEGFDDEEDNAYRGWG